MTNRETIVMIYIKDSILIYKSLLKIEKARLSDGKANMYF
jgi:hypothetical protein